MDGGGLQPGAAQQCAVALDRTLAAVLEDSACTSSGDGGSRPSSDAVPTGNSTSSALFRRPPGDGFPVVPVQRLVQRTLSDIVSTTHTACRGDVYVLHYATPGVKAPPPKEAVGEPARKLRRSGISQFFNRAERELSDDDELEAVQAYTMAAKKPVKKRLPRRPAAMEE